MPQSFKGAGKFMNLDLLLFSKIFPNQQNDESVYSIVIPSGIDLKRMSLYYNDHKLSTMLKASVKILLNLFFYDIIEYEIMSMSMGNTLNKSHFFLTQFGLIIIKSCKSILRGCLNITCTYRAI